MWLVFEINSHALRKFTYGQNSYLTSVMLGNPSTWTMIWSPANSARQPTSTTWDGWDLVIWFNGWDHIKRSKKAQERPSLLSLQLRISLERGRAERTTQLERREEKGDEGLPRFGGSESICFKSVIGGSNVHGFVPNLVISFYTWVLRSGQFVWGFVEHTIRFGRGFVSSGDCSFNTEQFR